jgi:hypothetical protein
LVRNHVCIKTAEVRTGVWTTKDFFQALIHVACLEAMMLASRDLTSIVLDVVVSSAEVFDSFLQFRIFPIIRNDNVKLRTWPVDVACCHSSIEDDVNSLSADSDEEVDRREAFNGEGFWVVGTSQSKLVAGLIRAFEAANQGDTEVKDIRSFSGQSRATKVKKGRTQLSHLSSPEQLRQQIVGWTLLEGRFTEQVEVGIDRDQLTCCYEWSQYLDLSSLSALFENSNAVRGASINRLNPVVGRMALGAGIELQNLVDIFVVALLTWGDLG